MEKLVTTYRQFRRKLRRSRCGNATMLVALGMPVLIGGIGLGVDTTQWFLWKREMQHAVDQAALGGAWTLSQKSITDTKGNVLFYKYRAKQEYNANLAVTKKFAGDPSIVLADYAGGDDNSVVVTASATKVLPFSSFLTNSAAVIRVRSQASYAKGADWNACLVALADEDNVINIGGNATVKARCGLAALSCEDNAVVISGSAKVTTDSIATCGTADVPAGNADQVTEGVQGLEDIYDELEPPDNPTQRTYRCLGSGKGQASLQPGTYAGLVVTCPTVLTSGIYVIDGGELDLTGNFDVTGTNVMFVLKNHARIKFGGQGNKNNKLTLTPMVASDFAGTPYADNADKYAGMLIFEHRDNKPANPGHKLNGNANSLIEGLIYLPSGEVEILGTADVASQCLQISAYKIKVSGNAKLETLCPTEDSTKVGTSKADVRLVA